MEKSIMNENQMATIRITNGNSEFFINENGIAIFSGNITFNTQNREE